MIDQESIEMKPLMIYLFLKLTVVETFRASQEKHLCNIKVTWMCQQKQPHFKGTIGVFQTTNNKTDFYLLNQEIQQIHFITFKTFLPFFFHTYK